VLDGVLVIEPVVGVMELPSADCIVEVADGNAALNPEVLGNVFAPVVDMRG